MELDEIFEKVANADPAEREDLARRLVKQYDGPEEVLLVEMMDEFLSKFVVLEE